MKNFRHYASLCAAVLLFFCTSCNEGEDPIPPTENPTVAFSTDKQITETTATFTIMTTAAEKAAYMLLLGEADAPAASEIMEGGTSLSGKDDYSVTVENLTGNTAYAVYAAAVNGTTLSSVAKLEFTTAAPVEKELLTLTEKGKNFVSYHIEAEQGATYRHSVILRKVIDAVTTDELTDEEYKQRIEMLLTIYGQDGTGTKDYTARDMETYAEGKTHAIYAGMDYRLIACLTDGTGGYVGDYKMIEVMTTDPQVNGLTIGTEIVDLQATEVTIRYDVAPDLLYIVEQAYPKGLSDQLIEEGGEQMLLEHLFNLAPRTQDFVKLSEWMNLVPETDYIHYVIGVDEQGDRTELFETHFTTPKEQPIDDGLDTENLEFNYLGEARCFGSTVDENENVVYEYEVLLSTEPLELQGWWMLPTVYPCHTVKLTFYTDVEVVAENPVLTAGTYTLATSSATNTISTQYSIGDYYLNDTDLSTTIYFKSGTVDITLEGEIYTLDIDLLTEDDAIYSGLFTGEMPIEMLGPTPFSNKRSRDKAPANQGAIRLPQRR